MKDIENIGKSLSRVTRLSAGRFEVKFRAAGGAAQTVTWTVTDVDGLFLVDGDLIRFDPHGDVVQVIGRSALSTVERLP